ncbi:gliding motility-associated C-terminal domain-containing protein, partial [bacterium AH-315-C07]|nr:gliding motility-associated C-terminal domain-containing protein [bacterium AH-315-C07]
NITDCDLTAGSLGSGGAGGTGGTGGTGGSSGSGGCADACTGTGEGNAGSGGSGGNGGTGGSGGSGSNGQSASIYEDAGGTAVNQTDVSDPAEPVITVDNGGCTDKDVTFTTSSPGTTYNWDFGSNASPQFASGASPAPTQFTSIDYHTISLTIDGSTSIFTDYVGILTSATASNPAIVPSRTDTLCPVDIVKFESSINDVTNYSWKIFDSSFNTLHDYNGSIYESISDTFNTPGQFWVTLKTTSDCCGDSDTDTLKIIVDTIPVANITGDVALCDGECAKLYAGGGSSYIWGNGFVTDSITACIDSTKTYSVTAYTNNGCPGLPVNHTIAITAEHKVFLSSQDTLDICPISVNGVQIVQLDAFSTSTNTGLIYYWSSDVGLLDTTSVSSLSVTPYATTIYRVFVNDNGCLSNPDSIMVNVSDLTANIVDSNNVSCFGMSDGNATVSRSGGLQGFNYKWNDASSQTTTTASGLGPGTYVVIITDTIGCTVTDTVTITEPPAVAASITGKDTICPNDSTTGTPISVTLSGRSPWNLSYANGTDTTLINAIATSPYNFNSGVLTATAIYKLISVTDSIGCPGTLSDSATIKVDPLATVDAGIDTTICQGNSVQLSGSFTNATAGQWVSGSGVFSPNNLAANASYAPNAAEESAGLSILIWQNTDGCGTASDTVDITITPLSVANAGTDKAICSDGIATVSASMTNSSTGTWFGGSGTFGNLTDTSTSYTPDASELGSVVILNWIAFEGCKPDTDQVNLYVNSVLNIDAGNDTNLICDNTADIAALASGGSGSSFNYQWAGGPSTINYDSVGSGTYYIAVTDSLGCTASDSIIIGYLNSTLALSITADTSICSGSQIPLQAIPSGGTTPYTLLWSNTATSDTINAGTGSWTAEVRDDDNCKANQTTVITAALIASVSVGLDTTICPGDSVQLNATLVNATIGNWTSGIGTYLTSINDSNSIYLTAPAEDAAGSVTLVWENVDGCGTSKDSMVITILPAATVTAGQDQTVCPADTADITVSIANATTLLWSGGAGVIMNTISDSTSYLPSQAETGSIVTLLVQNTDGCGTTTDSIKITVNPLVSVNAGADTAICQGNNVKLNAILTNATIGKWISGTGTFSPDSLAANAEYYPTVSEETSGSVLLIWQNRDGCGIASDTVEVTITPISVANAGTDQAICSGEIANLNASLANSNTGLWVGGSGIFGNANDTTTTYTPDVSEVGSVVSLNWIALEGCKPDTAQIRIYVNTDLSVNAGNDTSLICDNTADISAAASGGSGSSYIYQWAGGPSTSNYDTVGSGTYFITVTDSLVCSASDSIIVGYLNSTLALSLTADTSICTGNQVVLQAIPSGGSTPYTLSWNSGSTNDTINVGSGTWTVELKDNDNCKANETSTITAIPLAIVTAGLAKTICSGDSVQLNATLTNATIGNWTTGSGVYINSNNDLNAIYIPSSAEESAGSVSLTWENTDGCGIAKDSIVITILPKATITASLDQTICPGDSANLFAAISNATTLLWNGGAGSIYDSSADTTYYLPDPSETNSTVTLVVRNTDGCGTSADSINITISPLVTVDAGQNQVICAEGTVDLSVLMLNTSNGTWAGGSGVFGNITDTATTYIPDNSEYGSTVILNWRNTAGCGRDTDYVNIFVNTIINVNAGNDTSLVCDNTVDLLATSSGGSGSHTYQWSGGPSSATYDTVGSGTYFAVATDSLGCTNFDSIIVTYTNSTIAITLSKDTSICSGDSVIIRAFPSGGNTPYSLTWSNNATDDSIKVTSGSWAAEVTDFNNCKANETVSIDQTPDAIAHSGPSLTICPGDSIVLGASLTNANSGMWVSGSGTFLPDNTNPNAVYLASSAEESAGVTALVWQTTDGCGVDIDSMKVIFILGVTLSAGQDQIICTGDTVDLSASLTGATTGMWSGGAGSFDNRFVKITKYVPDQSEYGTTVILSWANIDGCGNLSDDINIIIPSETQATISGTDTLCPGTQTLGTPINVVITGVSPWSISYYNGIDTVSISNILTSPYQFDSDTLAQSTTYVLTKVGNFLSCPGNVTGSAFISVDPLAVIDAGGDSTICQGENIQLNATLINANNGLWTGGTGVFSPDNNTVNAVYTPGSSEESSGFANLYWQNTDGCGSFNDMVTITITPKAIVDAGPDQELCSDGLVNLSAGLVNSTSGLWSGGSGTFNAPADSTTIYTPDNSEIGTTINLKWISTQGCSVDSDLVNITINSKLVVDAGNDSSIYCDNKVFLLAQAQGGTGSGTYAYQWLGGPATSNYDNVGSGTYHIYITDGIGCMAMDSILIEYLNSTLALDLTKDTILCNGDSAILTSVGSGGVGSITYSWSTGATTKSIYVGIGNWTAEIFDDNNCSVNKSVIVTESPLLTVDADTNQLIFCDATADLRATASGGDNNYNFQWLGGPSTANWDLVGAGKYHVTVTDGMGCKDFDKVIVSYGNTDLAVNIIPSDTAITICFGSNIDLNAVGSGGNAPYTFKWNTGDTDSAIVVGKGSWLVEVRDQDNCSNNDLVVVDYLPPLDIRAFGGDSVCPGESVTIYAEANGGDAANYSYSWEFEGSIIGNSKSLDVIPGQSSTYIIHLKDNCSIPDVSDTVSVTLHDLPVPVIEADPQTTDIKDPIINFTGSNSIDANDYFWDFGDGGMWSYIPDPVHGYEDTGTFVVTLVVTNTKTGCIDTITELVVIEEVANFFVPNSFTPNGDGLNDGFMWQGRGVTEFEMFIFNRWGEMIFYSDKASNPWNGRFDNTGEMSQDGVYVVLIEYKDIVDRNLFKRYMGMVVLLK